MAGKLDLNLASHGLNRTFVCVAPAAGDSSPALWRDKDSAPTPGTQDLLQMASKFNGQRTARRFEIVTKLNFNTVDAGNGLTVKRSEIPATISIVLPLNIPDAVTRKQIATIGSIMSQEKVIEWIVSGFAPSDN